MDRFKVLLNYSRDLMLYEKAGQRYLIFNESDAKWGENTFLDIDVSNARMEGSNTRVSGEKAEEIKKDLEEFAKANGLKCRFT